MAGKTTQQTYGIPGQGLTITNNSGGNEFVDSTVFANAVRNQPASPDFDADAYVASMNPASLMEILEFGANLPGAGDRAAASAAAQRRLSALQPTQVPTGNGMGANGAQQGNSGVNPDQGVAQGTNNTAVPDTVVDYGPGSANDVVGPRPGNVPAGNVPTTNGMAPNGGQVGITPSTPANGGGGVGGGVPVQGGSGGVPSGQAGNWGQFQDFYQNQFDQLVGQSQQSQQAQMAAALRRDQAGSQPQESFQADWSWADLPNTQTQAGDGASYAWNENIDRPRGVTNESLLDQANLGASADQWFRNNLEQAGALDSQFWGTKNSPDDFNYDPAAQGYYDQLFDALYTQEGNLPGNIPAGYAAPIEGYQGVPSMAAAGAPSYAGLVTGGGFGGGNGGYGTGGIPL